MITKAVAALAFGLAHAKLADRSRVVQKRGGTYRDNGRPLEGPSYRSTRADAERSVIASQKQHQQKQNTDPSPLHPVTHEKRDLSSQLSGCCYTYQDYSANNMCYLYGNDCESGETPSHDSGDGDCSQEGLSFIGISFSVNTASGNPYSYQLCDQFPMENIIDRDYEYVMSMDEDGWLVGGGYKTFDYSGKMP